MNRGWCTCWNGLENMAGPDLPETYLSRLKDRIQQSPLSVKRNFLTAARVFFDSAANVIRAVCTAKDDVPTQNKYDWQGKTLELRQIEFTTLVSHLIDSESHEPNDLTKCDFAESAKFEIPDSESSKKAVVLVALHEPASSLPVVEDAVIVYTERRLRQHQKPYRQCVMKIDGLDYYLDKNERIQSPVTVYFPTNVCAAANSLRVMRNTIAGHSPTASLDDVPFNTMLEKVKNAYDTLMVEIPEDDRKRLMEEFEKIKEEKLFNKEEVKQALEEMWADTRLQQNMLESKIDELDEKLTNATDSFENVEQELRTATGELKRKLEEELAEAKKEREKFKKEQDEVQEELKGILERLNKVERRQDEMEVKTEKMSDDVKDLKRKEQERRRREGEEMPPVSHPELDEVPTQAELFREENSPMTIFQSIATCEDCKFFGYKLLSYNDEYQGPDNAMQDTDGLVEEHTNVAGFVEAIINKWLHNRQYIRTYRQLIISIKQPSTYRDLVKAKSQQKWRDEKDLPLNLARYDLIIPGLEELARAARV